MREFIDTAILTQPPTFRTNQQNTNADSIGCNVFLESTLSLSFSKESFAAYGSFFSGKSNMAN